MTKVRLLGIDYGRKRIGLAVCDELGISTRAIGFVPRESDRAAAVIVARVAVEEQAEALVLGEPVHADGREGAAVAWVRAFAAELATICPLSQHFVDERYSSDEAEDALRAQGEVRPTAGRVDSMAAAILLRRHLDGER